MNISELTSELSNNMPKLLDEETYLKVLNYNNNLHRFDSINRIALNILSDKRIYDVKTKEEWFKHGRKVADIKDKHYIIVPDYKPTYKDLETGDKININEFTQDEIRKALELNIIGVEANLEHLIVEVVYDIKNTVGINNGLSYSDKRPNLELVDLKNIAAKLCDLTLEPSDETFYSKKDKHLFLAKETYGKSITILADIITNEYISNRLEDSIKELEEDELRLLKSSIVYCICSLFNVDYKDEIVIVFRDCNSNECRTLANIINICDSVMSDITSLVYKDETLSKDGTASIIKIKKATMLLDIMLANSITLKMKGV